MKNKFQKSVQERQESVGSLEQEFARTSPSTQVEKNESQSSATPNIGEIIRLNPARAAKNKTFYLDEDVIEALRDAAKEQKVTDSKLVNAILRTVLIKGV